MYLTRQFIARQPKRVLDNLLMQIPLNLKDNLTHRHPGRPAIKTSLSFTHTHIVAGGINTDVCSDAHVQAVFHTTQPFADRVFGDF